jgi:hypothetical protein
VTSPVWGGSATDAGRLSVLTHGVPLGWLVGQQVVTETRPFADDQVAFGPIEQDPSPPPESWAVDRRFFCELVWLQKP